MSKFEYVENIILYVEDLKKRKPIIEAEKVGLVQAYQCKSKKVIKTKTNGVVETINSTKNDNDWIIVKLNKKNKKTYTKWIVTNEQFINNYELVDKGRSIYKTKKEIRKFIEVDENIQFLAPWGAMMYLKRGGYLNITNNNDVYGLQKTDFEDCYKVIDEMKLDRTKLSQDNLIEIWGTYSDYAENNTSKRQTINSFYLSVEIAIIGFVLNYLKQIGVGLSVIGIIICIIWILTINSYKNLNAAKFQVIDKLESEIGFKPFLEEYKITKKNKYISLTTIDKIVPNIFILINIVMLVCSIVSL